MKDETVVPEGSDIAAVKTFGRFKPISFSELSLKKFPASKWLIEGIVPLEGITILSGAPASFKTWFLLAMAKNIAEGGEFLDEFTCSQSGVLIIDEENSLNLIRERLRKMGADKDLPIYFLSQKGFLATTDQDIESIVQFCKEEGILTVFIDSLVRISHADENDASQMANVFRNLRRFCQNGITVVLTHHERKDGIIKSPASERMRGSSDISAAVDAHLALKRDKSNRDKIFVEQAKLRSGKEREPFEVEIREDAAGRFEFKYLGVQVGKREKKEEAKTAILTVCEGGKEGLSMTQISTMVKGKVSVGDKNIREAIRELLKDGLLLERRGNKNTRICYHPKFVSDTKPDDENEPI